MSSFVTVSAPHVTHLGRENSVPVAVETVKEGHRLGGGHAELVSTGGDLRYGQN